MKYLFILHLIILPLFTLFSETLVLKDGTVIKMVLKAQDVNTLTYTLKGKEYKVSKNKIRRVIYAKTPELEEKIAKEEIQKIRKEKTAQKNIKSKDEEELEPKLLDEEIVKALEEQEKQERLNLSFEERIHKLENELFELRASGKENLSKKILKIEEDVKDLKNRTRRIERFLEIDPDIDDYYSKPRSMWSIVWRSALLPGWGLTYGRDEGFGSMYTSIFFVTAVGGYGYKSSLKSLDKSLNDKFINDFIVQPIVISRLAESTALTSATASTSDISNIQSANTTIKLVKYIQSRNAFDRQIQSSDRVISFAIGLYAVQLIHSAIYGYFWEKRVPSKFLEEKTSGWKMHLSPLAKRNPITNSQSWQMEIGYQFEF